MKHTVFLWLFLTGSVLSTFAAGAERTAIFVHVPAEPTWRDMACLATVPAARVANNGCPVVLALSNPDHIAPEIQDYLKRYKPDALYAIGCTYPNAKPLTAASADAAARVLAATFWRTAETVVCCPEDDYTAALVASTLAGRLGAPLLFCPAQGLSPETAAQLKRLKAKKALFVGDSAPAAAALEKASLNVTRLADVHAVLGWMKTHHIMADYLAVVNPTDRTRTVRKKLSLAAPLLAVAREGMVIPVAYDVQWKTGFRGTPLGKEEQPPAGVPASKAPPRKGRIEIGKGYDFVVTGEKDDHRARLNIDLNANGRFNDPGEGPFAIADTVELEGKTWALALGAKSGAGKFDVWLTWPTAGQIRQDLLKVTRTEAGHAEYLLLVGFPDAIPAFIVRKDPGAPSDLQSDFPYANVDDDPFAELCVSRLIAEDASSATLYASRVLTYPHLLDGSWSDNVGQARWENTYWPIFENVGFKREFRHDVENLKWLVQPGPDNKRGKREKSINQDSDLTHVAAMAHMAHSYWIELGQTYWWDSDALLAPVVIESGGCLTAAMDKEPDYRSVIARLLRNGAVAFHGNAREGIAYQEQLRHEFWNGVLAGETIGRAHRQAQNSSLLSALDRNEKDSGPDHYSLYIRTLFGDPALTMHIPSKPRSAPAHVTADGDVMTVHGPAQWWPLKMRVPEDWKKWSDKDLYVCRGAGTYAVRHWCGEEYDKEEMHVNAELRTSRKIKAITQVQTPPKPLGWYGTYWVDEHPGTGERTYRWRVRVLDFDQIKGEIVNRIDRLEYRIEWE